MAFDATRVRYERIRPMMDCWPNRLPAKRCFLMVCLACIVLVMVVVVMLERSASEDRRLQEFFAQHAGENVQNQLEKLAGEHIDTDRLWKLFPDMPLLLNPEALMCMFDNETESCALREQQRPVLQLGYFDSQKLQTLVAESSTAGKRNHWRLLGNWSTSVCLERTQPQPPLTVCATLIEQRKDYWYVNGRNGDGLSDQWPARAFLNCAISVVRFERSAIAVPRPLDQFQKQRRHSQFLECDRGLADEVRQKHPSIFSGRRVISVDHADALAYYRDLLIRVGITPMLSGGTALGWYRECSLLTHTTDMDMSFLADQYTDRLQTAVVADPALSLKYLFGRPDDSFELSVMARGIKIDLFAIYRDGDSSWIGGIKHDDRKKLRWTYPLVTEICACDLIGRLFFVPCNIEQFLLADYGPNWRIPHHTSNFIWYSSHSNVHDIGYWPASEWKSVYRSF